MHLLGGAITFFPALGVIPLHTQVVSGLLPVLGYNYTVFQDPALLQSLQGYVRVVLRVFYQENLEVVGVRRLHLEESVPEVPGSSSTFRKAIRRSVRLQGF
jgi:hypothetical protein